MAEFLDILSKVYVWIAPFMAIEIAIEDVTEGYAVFFRLVLTFFVVGADFLQDAAHEVGVAAGKHEEG